MNKEKELKNLSKKELLIEIEKIKESYNKKITNAEVENQRYINDLKRMYNNKLKEADKEINKKIKEIEKRNEEIERQNTKFEKCNKKIEMLEGKIRNLEEKLSEQIALYEKKVEEYNKIAYEKYVKKTEKLKKIEEEAVVVNEVEEIKGKEKIRKPRKKMAEQFLKALKEMISETVIEDYDFEKNNVDKTKVKKFGEDRNIKIEVETKYKVVEHVRPKYKDGNKIYEALSEDVFPHSVLTPSFAANIIIYKYRLSVPLYRYANILKSSNINISEYDLSNYVTRAANIMKPLYDEFMEELLKSKTIHIDETTLNVLDVKDKEKCYMFVYRSSKWDEHQVSVYEFNETRKTDKVCENLKDYNGYLVCDGYTGYDKLDNEKITIQRCFAHIRRYFYDCIKILPKKESIKHPAYKVVEIIGKIYKKEKYFLKNNYGKEKVRKERNSEEYKKLLKMMDEEIIKIKGNNEISACLSKAVNYYENIKEKGELLTFLECGEIEIDNNICERTVKPFVIGRKNFLFSKTKNGAETSAICYTIVQTAINNNVDPGSYIEYVLNSSIKRDIREILPWSDEVKKNCNVLISNNIKVNPGYPEM